MAGQSSHEDYSRSNDADMGSERSFGVVFAVVFGVAGGYWVFQGDFDWGYPALGISALFALAALAAPSVLRPLNIVWFRFGQLLHKIVSPLILGVLFFLTVTPIALIFKALGKDPLSLSPNSQAKSYWIHREPPGPEPQSMSNQF